LIQRFLATGKSSKSFTLRPVENFVLERAMKRPQNFPNTDASRMSLWMVAAAIFAGAFWFAAAPSGIADPNDCTICHKRTATLVVQCNSLDYRRHKDHGDTDGACSPSMGSVPSKGGLSLKPKK
jgi:hypothetical protein